MGGRAIRVLLVLGVASLGAVAQAELPIVDVEARRTADGATVESVAVALPEARFPGVAARCRSARVSAERRARGSLHGYVDRAAGATLSAAALVRAHGAVDAHAAVVETRSLVDCGAVVRVTLPLAELQQAVGTEVVWP